MEKHFNQNINTLYSDNGGEYMALANFLAFNGISHLTTPPHTPEHNGFSERRHLHIVETGFTLLFHASIPLTYWSNAFATAVYLINRMPTPTLKLLSPYERFFVLLPIIQNSKFLVVYAILGFAHILHTNLSHTPNHAFFSGTL